MESIARATSDIFGVPRSRILVRDWVDGEFRTIGAEITNIPIVLIEHNPPIDRDYVSFNAGEDFSSSINDLSELQVASRICRAVRSRVILVAKHSGEDEIWVLVASDGSSGNVMVDAEDLDEGIFTIVGAMQPIAGAPELPLINP